MAALPSSLRYHPIFLDSNIILFPIFIPSAKLVTSNSYRAKKIAHAICSIRNSSSTLLVRGISISNAFKQNPEDYCEERSEILLNTNRWMKLIRDTFPGGSWWNLSYFEGKQSISSIGAKPTKVLEALNQIWGLVADKKWILYTAFGALTIAAFSEISMPGILATAVFAAQNGETSVFFQNSRLLIILCFISGISSGLRSGCFAVANVILVKRLRETLYSSLLLQDISFFDTEAVGELTSRISTDCHRLSNIVGNDLHLILRNILQGSGAFINLMALSWPLAISSLVICFILSAIFIVYGQYQKKLALLAQDSVASANDVSQETFSLMRTIRAYGTEKEEFHRFMKCLNRLESVCMRESLAYGLWNLSFHTFYRMTQVFAVLLGGLSIFAGSVSAEQLTKYVLYCEWLIFAAWRLQDSMSSLFQSVGACDKVFQLMLLQPSHQFTSEGIKLQSLAGSIDFVNVSFHYSSRNMILVDGIPLREMDIGWLRENIGFVGQEPRLFHTDVKSNISYGCFRSIEQEEIEYAAKNACAHDFISALPNGYDTVIDENLLSGGQKQRIAVARALLRDPSVLLLDEATSALDAESESYVMEILHSSKKERQRTVIIIAHRLSTVKAADRILVMNDGKVAEVGHDELVQHTFR